MGRSGIALSVFLLSTAVAWADDAATTPTLQDGSALMEHRWPSVPEDHALSLEDQITDHLSEIGNTIGAHMSQLSDHLLSMSVDGRHNRARLRLGGGNPHYLAFKVDSDWLFADGKAHIKAKLELGVLGHMMEVELPNMDLSRDSYQGQDMVTVNVSVLQRRF